MRVALETNGLFTTQAGVARYIRGLRSGFAELAPANVQFVEIAWRVENFAHRQPWRALKTAYRELFWAKWIAPSLIRRASVDVFHSTQNGVVLPPRPLPEVTTLHDLAFLRHPERFRRWQRIAGIRRYRHLKAAQRVICVSQFTADEAIALLGLEPAKLEVVYHGCEFQEGPTRPMPAPPALVLPSEYYLFVGSLEPGKNLALLKQVYLVARESGRNLPPLLIIGARWKGVRSEGPPPPDWHYLGRQADTVLEYLYRHALGLVFPSKYEGFGLPVIEAMALGCPVICAPVASLPEVAGAAALMAKLTPEDYSEAMRRLANDSALRRDLIVRGYQQAKRFTWKKCAEQTVEIYRGVLAKT